MLPRTPVLSPWLLLQGYWETQTAGKFIHVPECEWVSDDVSPTVARGAPGCLYPAQPGCRLQRGEDAVMHPGKITIILISCIVTCVCSILWLEKTGRCVPVLWNALILWGLSLPRKGSPSPWGVKLQKSWSCDEVIVVIKSPGTYCLVRWSVMFGRFFKTFFKPEKQNAMVCLQWGIYNPALLCYCFFKYMPTLCKGKLLAPVFFRHLGIKSSEIPLLETLKCHLFQFGALLLFENPSL